MDKGSEAPSIRGLKRGNHQLTLSLPLWIIKNDPDSPLGVNIWNPKGGMKGRDDT